MSNSRRRELLRLALGAALLPVARFTQAEQRVVTPEQMQGPFYPLEFPLDKDSDLTTFAGREGVAFGQIVTVSGQVLDANGRPQSSARVEIWQVNGHGRYHHQNDSSPNPIDPNFQGYGVVLTDGDGRYSFRTVKPVAYPGRAPHIHFAITPPSGRKLITQMYVAGARENDKDFLLSGIRDKAQRASLIVSFEAVRGGGEQAGEFNIVLPG